MEDDDEPNERQDQPPAQLLQVIAEGHADFTFLMASATSIMASYPRAAKAFSALRDLNSDIYIPITSSIHDFKVSDIGGTERSYDSRYWGLVDASWVVGRAYPGRNTLLVRGDSLE